MSTEDKNKLTKAEVDAELKRVFEDLKQDMGAGLTDIKKRIEILKEMKSMIDD